MVWLSFLPPLEHRLDGERIFLRSPRNADYHEWAGLRSESRDFLEPWEPRWRPDELGRRGWRRRLASYRRERKRGSGEVFFIFKRESERLTGGISVGNIRYGATRSGHIGYWMGEKYAGQGLMGEALKLVCAFCFQTLRLHRIEAACIPENTRSVRVLEKAGFSREGLLRSYLCINGSWRDHHLYALIEDDFQDKQDQG